MIVIDKLTKSFGKLRVLDEVSLRCSQGECMALIGPNGCGKTTLMKSILGMVVPDSGQITFDGVSITNQWLYRETIGYMPQTGRYPDNMTIGQVIDMMRDIRKVAPADVDRVLFEAFEIDKLKNKRMRTLSGGTRQKVSACLAFMFHNRVLILDEPTAGLDPIATEILKDKIQAEKKKGKLIIITSHVLNELDDLVTEVVYMQEGRVYFHRSMDWLKQETGEERLSKVISQVIRKNNLGTYLKTTVHE